MTVSLGSSAPAFSLPDQSGRVHALEDYRGKWVLLYFYPKDDTPGCTTEACGFRDRFGELQEKGIVVLGVSGDTAESHAKFAEKYSLPFPLLADVNHKIIEVYGVWREKQRMGKISMGIVRVSFLIDPEGKIAKIYDPVVPEGHVKEVLCDLVHS